MSKKKKQLLVCVILKSVSDYHQAEITRRNGTLTCFLLSLFKHSWWHSDTDVIENNLLNTQKLLKVLFYLLASLSLSLIPRCQTRNLQQNCYQSRSLLLSCVRWTERPLIDRKGRKIGCQSTNRTLFNAPSRDAFGSLRIDVTKVLGCMWGHSILRPFYHFLQKAWGGFTLCWSLRTGVPESSCFN